MYKVRARFQARHIQEHRGGEAIDGSWSLDLLRKPTFLNRCLLALSISPVCVLCTCSTIRRFHTSDSAQSFARPVARARFDATRVWQYDDVTIATAARPNADGLIRRVRACPRRGNRVRPDPHLAIHVNAYYCRPLLSLSCTMRLIGASGAKRVSEAKRNFSIILMDARIRPVDASGFCCLFASLSDPWNGIIGMESQGGGLRCRRISNLYTEKKY